MSVINLLVESALVPIILYEKNKIITFSPTFFELKGGDKLQSMGLEAWLREFFSSEPKLDNVLSAINNNLAFEAVLQRFSTGTPVNWLIKTVPLAIKNNKSDQQVMWLFDNSGENLRASYWDLYIKMNEALLIVQNTLEERSQALQRAEEAEKKHFFFHLYLKLILYL